MGRERLTSTTKGPLRRTVTIVGLVRMCFLVWVLSLFTVFGVTRYLKSGEES